jgi:hypothetical protein
MTRTTIESFGETGAADVRPMAGTAHLFKVTLVERSATPAGATGRDWYRYVLTSGNHNSTIVGHRRGSLEDVRSYAAQCAAQLNTRSLTAASAWTLRGRKSAATAGPKAR